jgi:hypothetical protein
MYYAASTYMCVPNAISQAGDALGAQAGGRTLRALLSEAGFSDVRTAAGTPLNMVLQARV